MKDGLVHRSGGFGRRWIQTADDLGNISARNRVVAWIFALGRERQKKFASAARITSRSFKPALLFQNGRQHFFSRAWIRCAFQHYELALANIGSDGCRRVGDVAEVGLVVLVQRRGHADDYRVHLRDALEFGSRTEAGVLRRSYLSRQNPINIRAAGIQGADLPLINIKARYRKLLLTVEQS